MDITGIAKSHQAGIQKLGKASSKLSDSLWKKADERWLRLLFGEPYEAKFQSEGTGSAVQVYDGNGDEILTYTAGVGSF